MSIVVFLGLVGFCYGCYLGVRRAVKRMAEERLREMDNQDKGRKRRVNACPDAPEELSQAELKAMGKWFSDQEEGTK